jgi:hypothetical protein
MNIFRSEVKFQKFINWLVKGATLIVSAPATIAVAKKAYSDVTGIAQIVVIAACVVLVEASFIYFWIRVEQKSTNVSKDEQLQMTNVLGCWVMYGVLLYAGFLHNEGMMTLLFRASIGLLLFIATRDRLVQTKVRIEEMVANGDYRNRRIQSAQGKSKEKVALARIKKDFELQMSLVKNDPDGMLAKQAEEGVYVMLVEHEQSIPKISKPSVKRSGEMMENEYYKISSIDDQFEVSCLRCSFHMLKPTRKAAALSGNSHQRVHTIPNHNGYHGKEAAESILKAKE